VVTTPAPRDAWREVIAASREATIFHTPEWLDACAAVGNLADASRLYELPGGERLVVPALRRPGLAHGCVTTWSMPYYWGYGGVLAKGSVTEDDVAAVLAEHPGTAPSRLVVKPGPHAAPAWRAVRPRARLSHCVHMVDLRSGFGELWREAFSSSTRNKIRKAEKRGVEVEWATADRALDDFWRLYLRWSARRARERGLPVRLALAMARRREPRARLEAAARVAGEHFRVLVARVEGEVVAATIVLTWGAHAHYWRSASDQSEIGQRYVNYLLIARLIEDVAASGCEYLDMGESGGVESLARFKEQFGAQPRVYDELRFEPRLVTGAVGARSWLNETAQSGALAAAARLRG
jgi:Acetyltransferase (GNAT) domain